MMPTTLKWTDEGNALSREALAAYAHEAWSGWMRWMLPNMGLAMTDKFGTLYLKIFDAPYSALDPDQKFWVSRWVRQANTSYADLSEREKESDRREAEKMLEILRQVGATLTVMDEPIRVDGDLSDEIT